MQSAVGLFVQEEVAKFSCQLSVTFVAHEVEEKGSRDIPRKDPCCMICYRRSGVLQKERERRKLH
jgi:hypothetical protein